MTYYFTSITANYFAKARVLGLSLKKYNPEAKFIIAMSDPLPDCINVSEEVADDILDIRQMDICSRMDAFLFMHNITELCTAVKPFVARYILQNYDASSVVYLDPDIAVFNSLSELESMFDDNSILLTPHQTVPENHDFFIKRNEILFLKRGTFNFGFFGVKNDSEGMRFLDWWNLRLQKFCFDDRYDIQPELEKEGLLGLFTDQKWADLIPCYFDNVKIIKEPGYNVCTWNLTQRYFENEGGRFTVDQKPLFFFHFSGFDSGGHINELRNIESYYPHNKKVEELSEWYAEELKRAGQSVFSKIHFDKSCYDNGVPIKDFERKLYHLRLDIHSIPQFENPFMVTDGLCFYNWVRQEYGRYFDIAAKAEQEERKNVLNRLLPKNSRRRAFAKRIYRLFK